MKKALFYLPLFVAILWIEMLAAPTQLWFEKASSFYENQQYDSAVVYYEKVLDAGTINSDVLYNLGNTYYRLDKLGHAILHFERALKLSPRDADVIANLRFAKLNIVDRVPEPDRGFLENLLWYLHTLVPLTAQLWLLLIALFLLSLAFAWGLYASHNVRLWLIYFSVLFGVIIGLFSFSVGKKIYDIEKTRYAIVLEKTVDAKNAPEGDKVLFTVHGGTKFQIQKSQDNWSFVSLPNGVSGWVDNTTLGEI